ncbi:MAG: hypothetical protein RL701_2505 [Pseudomonadota bacterium]|jgi:endogenous inhibitor of DNA gyrase (YacG/DUF329 family)
MATLKCPICRRKMALSPLTATHPFCSPRCKLVDLGNWLGDSYAIPGSAADSVEEMDEEMLAALLREPS